MPEIDTSKWQAILADNLGFVATDEETVKELLADGVGAISIRRRGALPTERHGCLRLGDWQSLDVFGAVGVEFIDEEDRAEAWELAQRAAWGMNQPIDVVERAVAEAVRAERIRLVDLLRGFAGEMATDYAADMLNSLAGLFMKEVTAADGLNRMAAESSTPDPVEATNA